MTDLIHEQPHAEQPQQDKPSADPRDRQKKVFTYIAILFTIAFILILWSSLSNRSDNQMVLSQLKENAAALQSTADALQSSLAENAELTKRVDTLEGDLEAAQEALEQAESEYGTLSEQYTAAQETVQTQEEELTKLREQIAVLAQALDPDAPEADEAFAQQLEEILSQYRSAPTSEAPADGQPQN